jgi:hypothetical protein
VRILGNVGFSTKLHGITSQKTALLIFTSVVTSNIVYFVARTKNTWGILVRKLLCRLVVNPEPQVMQEGTESLSLPLPPHPFSSKELKINYPALS